MPRSSQSDVFQFADDLTNSAADEDLNVLSTKLQNDYQGLRDFCQDRNLHINLNKTQLIIFKPARKKLPDNFGIPLDDVIIQPSPAAVLLGVTLDQHLTMGLHIDTITKKCHGLLGMLRRASAYLPRELLKLVYTSTIRTQIEYCSATFFTSAPSNLKKLDVIQKIASRIITDSSPRSHSAPLQLQLGLESLQSRRQAHVIKLVEDIFSGKSHPHFTESFWQDLTNGSTSKNIARKRFSHFGIATLNEYKQSNETLTRPVDSA